MAAAMLISVDHAAATDPEPAGCPGPIQIHVIKCKGTSPEQNEETCMNEAIAMCSEACSSAMEAAFTPGGENDQACAQHCQSTGRTDCLGITYAQTVMTCQDTVRRLNVVGAPSACKAWGELNLMCSCVE